MYVCILGVGHLLGTDYAANHGSYWPAAEKTAADSFLLEA